MNTCSEIQALLPLYVGEDLEPQLESSVRAHLERGCAACAADLEGLSRSRSALLAIARSSPAPQVDLWPNVHAALRTEGLLAARVSSGARRPAPATRRLWLSAAAVFVAAGGVFLALRPGAASSSPKSQITDSGVTPDLPPVLVGGPQAEPPSLGGLRRLGPGDEPFYRDAVLYGQEVHGVPPDLNVRRTLGQDPSRPSLAGERLR